MQTSQRNRIDRHSWVIERLPRRRLPASSTAGTSVTHRTCNSTAARRLLAKACLASLGLVMAESGATLHHMHSLLAPVAALLCAVLRCAALCCVCAARFRRPASGVLLLKSAFPSVACTRAAIHRRPRVVPVYVRARSPHALLCTHGTHQVQRHGLPLRALQ